ncbi:hypothetical protein HanRHA438_Chr04g0152461 [Helianthus annuus]|nr:hypothetical protein HanRHA438_Chr04g0152461 [Helianthus annuus]
MQSIYFSRASLAKQREKKGIFSFGEFIHIHRKCFSLSNQYQTIKNSRIERITTNKTTYFKV